MEDRIQTIAKLVAEFDGTLETSEKILDKIKIIRTGIRREIDALMRELNALDTLNEYILAKRNELVHNKRPQVKTELVMTNKQERVEAVLDATLGVVQDGVPIFSTEDIQRQLKKLGIDLDVSYPPAVIATILGADKRFKKTKVGLYEYVGEMPKRIINKREVAS